MDRQAFDRLVIEHLSAAQRLAIRLTGRADAAEDLVQNALLRAARGWKSFEGRSAFRTWLFQIVIHAFRDGLDRRQGPGELAEDAADRRTSDPPSLAAAEELGRAVAGAVSNLPPRQREVMVLHVYEQLSDLEVAAVLGISPQNVRTTLHLGRQALREILRPYLDETGHAR